MDKKRSSITYEILVLLLTVLAGSLLEQMYSMVDIAIVGKFIGTSALSSVGGIAYHIILFVTYILMASSDASSILISHKVGEGDKHKIVNSLIVCMLNTVIISVISTIGVFILSEKILNIMGTPQDIMGDALIYLYIYSIGFIAVGIQTTGRAALRSLGDSKYPLIYLSIASILNIILDIVFVVVFKWGVGGAAWATVISQLVVALLTVTKLIKQVKIKFNISMSIQNMAVINTNETKKWVKQSFCMCVDYNTYVISGMIFQYRVNYYGNDSIAAMGILAKVENIYFMMASALGVACITVVSRYFGKQDKQTIKKVIHKAIKIGVILSIVISMGMFLNSEKLVRLFTNDESVIGIGSNLMMIISPFYVSYIFTEVLSGALRGCEKVVVPVAVAITSVCVIRVLWVILVTKLDLSLTVLYTGYIISWICSSIILYVYTKITKIV